METGYKALDLYLTARYPVWAKSWPLSLQVYSELREVIGWERQRTLRALVTKHTRTTRYLENLVCGDTRYHLNGKVASCVSESHKVFAEKLLAVPQSKRKETII